MFVVAGTGMTTTLIRVFAALEVASGLVTISTNAVKKGLNMAVETGKSVVECLQTAGMEEMEQNPKEHNYYKKFKWLDILFLAFFHNHPLRLIDDPLYPFHYLILFTNKKDWLLIMRWIPVGIKESLGSDLEKSFVKLLFNDHHKHHSVLNRKPNYPLGLGIQTMIHENLKLVVV